MARVGRIHHSLGKQDRLVTLEQRFRFDGDGVDATAVGEILRTAPLVGDSSIFGGRPGVEGPSTNGGRTMSGFSPAPGFKFDVQLTETRVNVFVVRFSQADRRAPYLEGEFAWIISDADGGAVFDEQINTAQASDIVAEPLIGPKLSLRRWLFFRVGHQQVMAGATKNIAALLSR